jgi:hypothetical protein
MRRATKTALKGGKRTRLAASLAAVAALGLCLAACGGESDWMPAPAPPHLAAGVWVGPTAEGASPEILTDVARLGPKVHVFAGRTLGYELTAESPAKFRFRWTTDNLANHTHVRRFTGSVWTPGRFVFFSPGCDDGSCDLEAGDHVSGVQNVAGGGERIDWDTLAKDGWDGFSFTTNGAPLYFEVAVDGRTRPELLQLVTWNQPDTPPDRAYVRPLPTTE